MRIATAWEAVFQFNPELTEHQIIHTLRLPRTVADLMVGCSLAICGAIMQGTTRNPLADSGLMGISSGSMFAMALCMAFLPMRTYGQTMLFGAFSQYISIKYHLGHALAYWTAGGTAGGKME